VLFDPETGETRAMRSKEDAHDYRYFPDPDLLPLIIDRPGSSAFARRDARTAQGAARRFIADYGLSAYDAKVLTSFARTSPTTYEAAVAVAGRANAKPCANWVMVDLPRA
jgi:aspartyl-tRNA(Asn)/glutamyl-tRNA(Gln) amidotransferase subunit B